MRQNEGYMKKDKKNGIPDFQTITQAAAFWDTHSISDYWEQTKSVQFDVDLRKNRNIVTLEDSISRKIRKEARRRKISSNTLVQRILEKQLA